MDFYFLAWEDSKYYVLTLAMSIFARLASIAVFAKRRTFREVCRIMLIGLFCGLIVALLVASADFAMTTKIALIGLAAFLGVDSLLFVVVYGLKKLGMSVTETVSDAKTLYNALNDHSSWANCSGKETLEHLLSTGKLTKAEYIAVFNKDLTALADLLKAKKISNYEFTSLLNSDLFKEPK